ncbi:DNA oxidative demethylase ALKBH2-like [Sitophilus oryzae]|uniref:DNA oxidative demethylase ALKBH2 n=1 Tax=Sitophilus oryzae TaxID=7048 RepID=A0A6J2XXI9_SITOR|nr:DNA oxidative demethylase ALKBH2-like [Sitophilus oryzae]
MTQCDGYISSGSLEKDLLSVATQKEKLKWMKLTGEMLDVDYTVLFPKPLSETLMDRLEQIVEYYTGDLTKVKVFGKWHQIPRQQVAYGDTGLKYTFSGTTIPAKPWFPLLELVKNVVEEISRCQFNFVLINKYRNGCDNIGPHRDDEKEIDKNTPIASLSLGQQRTFVFTHRDARLKGKLKRSIAPVKIELEPGSLLLMNSPTNEVWYHSLPPRKSLHSPRINLTFRKINS